MSSDSDGPGDGPLDSGSFDPDNELTPKQTKAVYLLLAGHSVTETAWKIGCHRSTVYRWRHDDPHFRAACNRGKNALFKQLDHGLRRQLGSDLGRRFRAAVAVLLAASESEVELIDKLLQEMGLLDG